MGVLKAKVDGDWVALDRYVAGPNPANALGIVKMGAFKSGLALPLTVTTADATITEPLTVTMFVGRCYRIVCQVRAVVGNESGTGSLRLCPFDGAADKASAWGDLYCNAIYAAGGPYDGIQTGFIVDGDGLSHSITIHATTTWGSASAYCEQNCRFYVEDIGPTSSQALPLPAIPQAWTAPAFLSGWGNFGLYGYAPAGYRKIGDIVSLRGLVSGGTVSQAVFVLPVGFRPAYGEVFAVDSYNHIHATLDIGANGNVVFTSGNNTHITLSGVSFSVTP